MKKNILLSILTLGFFSCKTNDQKMIDITNITITEGFLDVPLSIIATKELDNYFEYDAMATFKTEKVGIIIRLKKDIPAGFIDGEPKNMFLNDGIEFISKGVESDLLLWFLSNRYGIKNEFIKLKDTQMFTCANLNEKKPDYKSGSSRFKIFLESDEEYAELFVNFDFSKGIIYLNEKDEEYRVPLIKLMKAN